MSYPSLPKPAQILSRPTSTGCWNLLWRSAFKGRPQSSPLPNFPSFSVISVDVIVINILLSSPLHKLAFAMSSYSNMQSFDKETCADGRSLLPLSQTTRKLKPSKSVRVKNTIKAIVHPVRTRREKKARKSESKEREEAERVANIDDFLACGRLVSVKPAIASPCTQLYLASQYHSY